MSKSKSSKKVVVFDFDGTMADTASIFREIYTGLAEKNNWRHPTDEDFENLRKGTITDARKWAGIPLWRLPFMVHSVKKAMREDVARVVLFPEMVKLVRDLHKEHVIIYILSRNLPETIEGVLRHYKLEGQAKILRRKKRYLGSKALTLMILLKNKKYDCSQVWMVGDEIRDIVAAKRAGVNSAAVTWGLQDESILKRYHPTCLVKSVTELRRVLRK